MPLIVAKTRANLIDSSWRESIFNCVERRREHYV
jgi:hypothetical protein